MTSYSPPFLTSFNTTTPRHSAVRLQAAIRFVVKVIATAHEPVSNNLAWVLLQAVEHPLFVPGTERTSNAAEEPVLDAAANIFSAVRVGEVMAHPEADSRDINNLQGKDAARTLASPADPDSRNPASFGSEFTARVIRCS